jgi:cytosine/adenosine deaminase-related metal-dependent hydrolase
MQIHLAEALECFSSRKEHVASPTADPGSSERTVAAHCVHVSPEMSSCCSSSTSCVPQSCQQPQARLRGVAGAGGRPGVARPGTDGAASNNTLDRCATPRSRPAPQGVAGDPTVPARTIVGLATVGGARCGTRPHRDLAGRHEAVWCARDRAPLRDADLARSPTSCSHARGRRPHVLRGRVLVRTAGADRRRGGFEPRQPSRRASRLSSG